MGLLNAYLENRDPNGDGSGGDPGPTPGGTGGGVPGPIPTPGTGPNGGFVLNPGASTPGAVQGGTEVPGSGGGNGNGGGTGLNLGELFPNLKFGPVPKFTAPGYVPLDAAGVLKDPGFQFREQQGESALQRAAASKGLLRSGGTLKDLVGYSQNFASNEYNQAEDRNRAAYSLNYQLSKDEYAPLLAEWNTMSAAQLQRALAMYNRGTIWGAPYHSGPGPVESLQGFGG